MARRAGGLLLRSLGALYFLPAHVAVSVVPRPVISAVPGTSLGMTLVGGRVLPVVDLRRQPGRRPLQVVVCEIDGEEIAIAGVSAVSSGFFEEAPGGVLLGEELVPTLDVSAELARLQRGLSERRTNLNSVPPLTGGSPRGLP
jgi:hypothetical protein